MTMLARTDRSLLGNWWWTVDRVLLLTIALLAAVGVVLIFAASPAVAEKVYGDGMRFVEKHVLFLLPASLVLVGISLLNPRGVLRLAFGVFGLFGFLMILTLFFASDIKGAHRWLNFGGAPLQPSEFVKPALAVIVAYLLSRRPGLGGLPITLAFVLPALVVLVRQPDIGMAAVICLVYGVQLFLAGIPWFVVIGFGGVGALGLWQAYAHLQHFRQRVDDFMDPDSVGYQVEQALRAVAQGGLFGRGPGEGVTKFRLPDAHADFIFAATAEEFGIIACLGLVGLFSFLILRGLFKVNETNDRFILLAGAGLVAQLGFQAVINMAVNLNLMPTKGMTLPFISYGGSSLLALAMAVGMLLALTRRGARLELAR